MPPFSRQKTCVQSADCPGLALKKPAKITNRIHARKYRKHGEMDFDIIQHYRGWHPKVCVNVYEKPLLDGLKSLLSIGRSVSVFGNSLWARGISVAQTVISVAQTVAHTCICGLRSCFAVPIFKTEIVNYFYLTLHVFCSVCNAAHRGEHDSGDEQVLRKVHSFAKQFYKKNENVCTIEKYLANLPLQP